MSSFRIAQLEREWCEYFDADDEPRELIDGDDHFSDIAYWVAKALGHNNASFSEVSLSYYDDTWEHSDCPVLGRAEGDALIWKHDEDKSGMEYLVHVIIKRPTWGIDASNKPTVEPKLMALCVTGDSGSEEVYYEMHEVGKCPNSLYEHEIMKDEKVKIQVTYYAHFKGRDMHDKFDQVLEEALDNAFSESNVDDALGDEMYYELDDDLEIRVSRHKIKTTRVPKTRQI